jgi:type II secretory pathway pseudopilin PulG
LIEVMIALGVVVVVLIGLISAISFATRHNAINRENLAAMRAAEQQLEQIRSRPFQQIFSLYDPAVSLGEPGPNFPVQGLRPPAGRAAVGRVIFPGNPPGGPPAPLREGPTGDPDFDRFLRLDLPGNLTNHDLDMDGALDEPDVSGTYQLLPVCLELSWIGISGPRTVRYYHLLRQR